MPLQMESPYENLSGRWLRGNMHAHTTCSDGARSPSELVSVYAEMGYDWLCISDHDLVTPAPPDAPEALILLSGNEITANGPHILHVGAEVAVEPSPDRAKVIEEVAKAGGICVLNHPNWEKHFSHWPQDKLEAMPRKYDGIEIFNGIVIRHEGSPLATDRWDRLLSKGVRAWGYANDDTHNDFDLGNGWNRVCCRSRTVEDILVGLKQGRCYASTGVELSSLETVGTRIRIIARNGSLCIPVVDWGVEIGRFPGRAWEFEIEKLIGDRRPSYIRFEIHGDGVASAWTQPIYLSWT